MFSPGQQFAGYRVVRVLGAGGMGEVYLAQHPRLPREDALKVLPTQLTEDPTYRARFIREADLASGLDHPSIVSVYDRGEDQGQLWITMKYIPGSDANALMKQTGPFSPNDVVDVVTAVADALDYAHGRGLLHRDVKPANILIDGTSATRSKVYLTDFGIARTVGNDTALTAANLTVGSIQYTSPEQLRGGDLNGRADQYSLACTAFKLLTGRAPYPERKPTEIINAHLNHPIPRARTLRSELPAEVDAVLARGMDKRAVNRYPTCNDFARDLRAALRTSGGAPQFPATMINPGPSAPPTPMPTPVSPPKPMPAPAPWGQQSPPQTAPAPQSPAPQNPAPAYPAAAQQFAPIQQTPGQQAPGYPAAGSYGPPPYSGTPGAPAGYGGGSGPGGSKGKQIGLIVGAVVLVAALAVGLAFIVKSVSGGDDDTKASGTTSGTGGDTSVTSPPPSTSATATDPAVVNGVPTRCVDGRTTTNTSTTRLTSGKMSIPAAEMPSGWRADYSSRFPFVTQADGVTLNRPSSTSTGWIAQIAVGVLPSDFSTQTEDIARKVVECLSTGPGYSTVTVGTVRYDAPVNATLNERDTAYTLLNASIPVTGGPDGITGDDVIVVVVNSRPMTVAVGLSPIGDTRTRGAVDKAVRGLLVTD